MAQISDYVNTKQCNIISFDRYDIEWTENKQCLLCSLNPNHPEGAGRNYHPLLENRDFSRTEPPLDLRPVCKTKFVRFGPGEKKQSALSFSVEAWRPDEV